MYIPIYQINVFTKVGTFNEKMLTSSKNKKRNFRHSPSNSVTHFISEVFYYFLLIIWIPTYLLFLESQKVFIFSCSKLYM